MKLNKRAALLLLFAFTSLGLAAQPSVQPGFFLFPIKPGQRNFLSGSMGEIRSNHFHGGLDIKTDQREGLPVYAAADGYISRVKQSTYGYGNIVYITHPNGLVTTYAHLLSFYDDLAKYMLQNQYKKQTFELELFPEKTMFPIRKGQVIGLSGNTGGSGGPHLHFEVRDTEDRLYNPLKWGFSEIIDTTPPDIFTLGLQPLNIYGRVNQEFKRVEFTPVKNGNTYTLPDTVYAHGMLGLELQTNDRYDGTQNRNGTQDVTLYINNKQIYNHHIDQVPFELSRQVSQHINYTMYKRQGRTFQKAYVDHGNDLPLYTAPRNRGRIVVSADSVYQVRLVAKDSYNNASTLSFVIKGQKPTFTQTFSKAVKQPALTYEVQGNILKINATDTASSPRNVDLYKGNRRMSLVPSYTRNSTSVSLYDMRAGLPDSMTFCGISKRLNYQLVVPPGQEVNYKNNYLNVIFDKQSLYDTLYLETKLEGDVYTIGDFYTPLHKPIKVTITPEKVINDKTKAAVYFLGLGRGRGMLGGTWNGNSITFSTSNMGKFKVLEDTRPPSIKLLSKSKVQIRFRIGDDLSGINSFRAEVNGQWLLMKYEHKTATIYSEKLDKSIPLSGKVVLKVKDNAGNEAVFNTVI
ncbi:M23 family metallopeptidase [Pontibacter ruber]|uniref:M23 family metallopeptidase n=1 Tax=Pontibacter ruber TaxID=1343895 RepID=A0ABW5D069_9BACT|nr:M23 family metallopeptidase [Pontibacter ruber]